MAYYYLKEDDLQAGDPVCLVPGEPGRVKKATPEGLLAARAVLGVALSIIIPDPEDHGRRIAQVADAGSYPVDNWNPRRSDGIRRIPGDGNLLVARGGRCVRVSAPSSRDYVIGIVQEDETLVIQRDYELSLAPHRILNVRDFGAIGDRTTDDSPAFEAALAAVPPHPFGSTGTIIFIPPGWYRLTRDLEIKRELHLLGGGGAAGNAGVILDFDPGYGIVVHSHFSTPQLGQFGAGSVIEGLRIIGTPPGAIRGGSYTESFPTRWQPNTPYEVGSRVFMFRADPLEWRKGYSYHTGDRIRPPGRFDVVFEAHVTASGNSGETPPDWESRRDIPGVGLAVPDNDIYWIEPEGIQEWQPDHLYVTGQKIRPPGRCNVIFELHSDGRSGVSPINWNRMTYVNDVGWVVVEEETGISWVRQDDNLIDIQGYRDFYWECVQPGVSGTLTPEIARLGTLFTVDKAAVIDLSSEWQRGERYQVGQVIHPPNRFDMILVMKDDSTGDTAGDMEPNWDATGVVEDNGIRWLKRDPDPYFFSEGPEGPVWRCRVHAGIRIHSACTVRRCLIEGFLNAGIWICAAEGYYPQGNAIGWNVHETGINLCGTGILVRGTMAHQGTAINVQCVQIGQLPNMIGTNEWLGIDWQLERDRGGNGGISFFDLSYFGNQWISCTNEFALDRALVMEGTVNQNGTVIKFWDEGTGSRNSSFLSGSTILIGGLFNSGIDRRGVSARVSGKDFRQVEEVNENAPRRTRAMLHQQDADGVFMWTANRASGPGSEYNNTIGWRYRPSGNPVHWDAPVPHDWPPPHEWHFSYQENSPASYFTVQDGFGSLGVSWRDVAGHFRGIGDDVYYLGVARNSYKDPGVRRGFRQAGDRFEPPIASPSPRGHFLGRIVDRNGFRGWDPWHTGWYYHAYQEYAGWPASTIEVQGFVFICTRSGVGGIREPDFDAAIRGRNAAGAHPLSPVFQKGLIVSSWHPNTIQQVGMIKRPNQRHVDDGHYYLFVCSKVEGYGSTGHSEPVWPNTPGVEITEEVWDNDLRHQMISRVTWKCMGPDPDNDCIVDETTGLQWTCVGQVASFSEYGPVYEQAEVETTAGGPTLLDEYPITLNTCAQYDIVVTTLSNPPIHAATFTLRAAFFRTAAGIRQVGAIEVDRRSSEDVLNVMLQPEESASSIRLYVYGRNDSTVRWRSLRRPHSEASWL